MKTLLSIWFFVASYSVFSWDGYDYNTNSYIEIDKRNLVRQGREIEYYDYGVGEYVDVE